MDDNPSKFFDKILKLLAKDYNKVFTIEEVKNQIYKKQMVKIKNPNTIEEYFYDEYFESNIINAIMFLNREGLVAYNQNVKQVIINTKGYLKIKTESYSEEIYNKKLNTFLQRISWACSVVALVLSIYAILSKNGNVSSIPSNCICKPITMSTDHQSNGKYQP